jgi:hypothetical protein
VVDQEILKVEIMVTLEVAQHTSLLLMERFQVFLETKTRCFLLPEVVVRLLAVHAFVNTKEMAVLVVEQLVFQVYVLLMIADTVQRELAVLKSQEELVKPKPLRHHLDREHLRPC